MNFDTLIERRNTYSNKWDKMESIYGVPADAGLSMWVADTDFQAPPHVLQRLQKVVDHGVFGYTSVDPDYRAAIQWWMANRHGWDIDTNMIFTTTGLCNAVALCLDTYTQPGDGVVLFTPVYHPSRRTRGGGMPAGQHRWPVRDGF